MSKSSSETEWMKEHEVVELTKRALGTLRNDRSLRRGFPYVKVGRSVFYSKTAIEEYLTKHTINHAD